MLRPMAVALYYFTIITVSCERHHDNNYSMFCTIVQLLSGCNQLFNWWPVDELAQLHVRPEQTHFIKNNCTVSKGVQISVWCESQQVLGTRFGCT
jgi:hypothetical protein